jgi:hypothetical protein
MSASAGLMSRLFVIAALAIAAALCASTYFVSDHDASHHDQSMYSSTIDHRGAADNHPLSSDVDFDVHLIAVDSLPIFERRIALSTGEPGGLTQDYLCGLERPPRTALI